MNFTFAVIGDPHIAVPHTIWNHPKRFHLVEATIPAIEQIFEALIERKIDFLLLPGDLTQHGEPDNHAWLAERLEKLPFPTYVVPGNHDIPVPESDGISIAPSEFPSYYRKCGYANTDRHYYTCNPYPGVRLVALNSNGFNEDGKQNCRLDEEQLSWLQKVLEEATERVIFTTIHHNVVEHLPGQAKSSLGRRYMLENASEVLPILRRGGVQLVFTGHLHVQDIAFEDGIYDITTGSLASYPHPYRVFSFSTNDRGRQALQISSSFVRSTPDFPNLPEYSRNWTAERSRSFMVRLLMEPPFDLSAEEAERYAPSLRYLWADIARGDAAFEFPEFPAKLRQYIERFGAVDEEGYFQFIDNDATLLLKR